jgi:hypothetical protein
MGFSQTAITSVAPPVYLGFQVSLSWTCSSPATGYGAGGYGEGGYGSDSVGGGIWFQVYIDRQLTWWGQTTSARIAMPTVGPVRIDIGTVLPGEEQTDFSADLPAVSARRAELSWLGGTFEGADIAGFRVFGSDAAGGFGIGPFGHGPFGEIDLGVVLADITAYPGGITTDGFGFGGFGAGGFGAAASTYTWTSEPLTRGGWSYAVVPYDSAGNLGTAAVTGVTIVCPPLPPALYSDNTRLRYTYDAGTHEATLNWLASPG